MLRTLLILAALAISAPVAAQSAQPSPPSAIADTFFKTIQDGDTAKAYGDIWRGTMMQKKQADVENLIAQTDALLKMYGSVIGWELIKDEPVSASLDERTYLVRTANGPIFFKMQFYRAETHWIVSFFSLADSYKNLRG